MIRILKAKKKERSKKSFKWLLNLKRFLLLKLIFLKVTDIFFEIPFQLVLGSYKTFSYGKMRCLKKPAADKNCKVMQ